MIDRWYDRDSEMFNNEISDRRFECDRCYIYFRISVYFYRIDIKNLTY